MTPAANVFNVGWVSVSVTHHSRRQGSRLITGPRSKETSCACRFGGLRAGALTLSTLANELDEYQILQDMSGSAAAPPPNISVLCGYLIIRDFGVAWRHVQRAARNEQLFKDWLNQFETAEIISSPDCRLQRLLGC